MEVFYLLKRVVLLVVTFMFVFGASCLAWRATPYSIGIVTNENLSVLAVNLNGPAYSAGIRPGDQILSASLVGKNFTSIEAKNALYSTDEKPILVKYKHNDTIESVTVIPIKILDAAMRTTYLIEGDSLNNYERLVNKLTFHPKIAAIFPIQSMDNKMKMIRSFSSVDNKTVKEIPDYIVAIGGSGFGFTALETSGNFALTDSKDGNWSIAKITLGFRAEWAHMFGQTWGNFSSSGILERKVIECMFDNI